MEYSSHSRKPLNKEFDYFLDQTDINSVEGIIISTNFNIQTEELKPWLERESSSVLQPLHEQGKKLADKIRERLNDSRETCEKLADEGREEAEKGKAVRKARLTEKLSKYFLKQIDKVVFPEKLSFSELDRFHKDLEKTVSAIARERNKWFPRISPLFIISRKKADFAFSRLASSISELGNFLSSDYSKAKLTERLSSEIDEMIRLHDELNTYKSRKAGFEEKVQLLQGEIEESQERIESAKSSAELGDLSEINHRVQQLRKQVKHELRHLQKPFRKFVNLAGDSRHSLTSDEMEKLGQYLEDPFAAFAAEENGHPMLKHILGKMRRVMEEGKLKLKSSRLRKAHEKIDLILDKNTLDGLHRSCVETFALKKQLISSEETKAARRKLEQSHLRLEELDKRKEAAVARLDALGKEYELLVEKVKEQKSQLEKSVFEILGRRINVELGTSFE